jgi:hypothetical protein
VAQVAIQSLNESYYQGTDALLNLLITNAARAPVDIALNMLNFASRYLDALAPSPTVCRSVVKACIELALRGQPIFSRLPLADVYYTRNVGTDERPEERLQSEDLLVPLLAAIGVPGRLGAPTRDELLRYSESLIEGEDEIRAGLGVILAVNCPRLLKASRTLRSRDDYMADWSAQSVSCETLRRATVSYGHTNFWIPLESARRGCIGIASAIGTSGFEIILCSGISISHPSWSDEAEQPLIELILSEVTRAEDSRRLSPDSLHALKEAARAFGGRYSERRFRPFNTTWLKPTKLGNELVSPKFDADGSRADYVAELVHPLDVGRDSSTRSVSDGKSKGLPLRGDALFGAACLLALVMEKERWPLFDYSDDQIADLQIGLLNQAKPVFICRGSEAFWDELRVNIVNLGLRPRQSELLRRWAVKEVDFT